MRLRKVKPVMLEPIMSKSRHVGRVSECVFFLSIFLFLLVIFVLNRMHAAGRLSIVRSARASLSLNTGHRNHLFGAEPHAGIAKVER